MSSFWLGLALSVFSISAEAQVVESYRGILNLRLLFDLRTDTPKYYLTFETPTLNEEEGYGLLFHSPAADSNPLDGMDLVENVALDVREDLNLYLLLKQLQEHRLYVGARLQNILNPWFEEQSPFHLLTGIVGAEMPLGWPLNSKSGISQYVQVNVSPKAYKYNEALDDHIERPIFALLFATYLEWE